MKTIILLLIFIFSAITQGFTQVIPLGVYLDVDGKIKFWESEANMNGNVDDTVIVYFETKTWIDDLRNIKYIDLTFIEAPDEKWTLPSDSDPSRINDTIDENVADTFNYPLVNWLTLPLNYFFDSIIKVDSTQKEVEIEKYQDVIYGDGLTDSMAVIVKSYLIEYIKRFYDKYVPQDTLYALQTKLSQWDTVIEKIAIYDYLIDELIFYNYQKEKLCSIIGYHWNYGLEFDTLRYDRKGRLIYYSRLSVGAIRNEFYFKYNRRNQVVEVESFYSTTYQTDPESFSKPDIIKYKFTYDKAGKLNSKSTLMKDQPWSTVFYEIK